MFIDLLEMCYTDEFKYRKNLIVAGDFNKTNATVIYNNIANHASAIALNLYSNAVLQKFTGNSNSYIFTINEPIQLIKMVISITILFNRRVLNYILC